MVFTDRPPDAPAEPAAVRATTRAASSAAPAAVCANAATPRPRADLELDQRGGGQRIQFARHTVLGNNARTLEDLVKEMLRPMLKAWLDDNLPSMVERIVRAEIERVSRGRR